MATPLIGPDGKRYTLPDDSKLADAIAEGFRVEDAEGRTVGEAVRGTLDDVREGVVTAAEGVLRGGTAGLSDTAITGLSKTVDPEHADFNRAEMARRRQENPVIATGAEIVGAIRSPVNVVHKGTVGLIGAETALGRVGANIVGGGAAGSLFGAGNTLTEAALGNTEVTAEKLIAGAGLGALLGGAGGGVGGVIDEALAFALPRVARMATSRGLDDIANDAAVKASRAQQGVLNKMRPEQVKAAGKALLDRGHVKGSPADMVKSLEGDIAKVGAEKGAFLDAADDAMVAPDFKAAIGALDDFAMKLSPLEREAVEGSIGQARRSLEKVAQSDFNRGERAWRAFDKWKQDLQKKAKFSRGSVEDDLAVEGRRKLAGVAREELDRQLVPALGEQGQAFLGSKALYASLKDAERLATSGAGRAKPGGLGFGLYDLLAGGAGAHIDPSGLALAAVSKFAREQAPGLVARAAHAISKSPALKLAAASFAEQAPKAAAYFGPHAAPLAQAMAKGPAFGLAHHLVTAQTDPDYAAKAAQAGFMAETPEESGFAAAKAQGLVGVAAALKETDDEIDRGIDKAFRGGGKAKVPKVTGSQDFGTKRMRRTEGGHQRRMAEVAELAANPEALLERVTANIGSLGDYAPGVVAASSSLAHRAVSYLASQIQKPVKPGPLAQEWKFNDTELFVFSKKLETVEHPLSVLAAAAAGTLTKDQVAALQAVYPTIYGHIRDKAIERLASAPKGVPYRQRMMLQLLSGVDPDGTLGQSVSRNQAAIAAATQKPSEAPGSSSEKGPLKVAQQYATPGQRQELSADDQA